MNPPTLTLPTDLVWAIEPNFFDKMLATMSAYGSLGAIASTQRANLEMPSPYTDFEGIRVIEIDGVLERRPSILQWLFGGTSTDDVRSLIEEAADGDRIQAIVLRIDSPGGTADGLAEIGDTIQEVRKRIPIVSQVESLCASAAYYVAAGTEAIYSGRMDRIGSIGVTTTLYDFSKLFADAGIRPVCIDTGEFKSVGTNGLSISESQENYVREIVNGYFADFQTVVSRGRKLGSANLSAVSDGRIHLATEARKLGLIDGVQTIQQTLAGLRQRTTPRGPEAAAVRKLSASERFNAHINCEIEDDPTLTRQKAIVRVQAKYPEVHRAYIRETNPRNFNL